MTKVGLLLSLVYETFVPILVGQALPQECSTVQYSREHSTRRSIYCSRWEYQQQVSAVGHWGVTIQSSCKVFTAQTGRARLNYKYLRQNKRGIFSFLDIYRMICALAGNSGTAMYLVHIDNVEQAHISVYWIRAALRIKSCDMCGGGYIDCRRGCEGSR